MVEIPRRELYIGGQWVAPVNGQRLDIINPATEAVVGSIPAASAEDVNKAVEVATAAAKSGTWTKSTGAYRAGFLRKIAQKVRDRKEELASYETMDMGKPIEEAEWDMDDVAACFDYYADLAEKLDSRQNAVIDVGTTDFEVKVRREALGVVALITPWNYPILMATWKVAPALAAGNCCILKPSEIASVTCLELAAIAHEVGLPAGALNVLSGDGPSAGGPLSSHPGCAKVAFTGSTATGRKVGASAANNLRPATLELGGKSCLIVFDDCDVEKAVEWAMFGCFLTGGQICTATSRIVVHEAVAPKFLELLKTRAESIKIGDPLEKGCRMGPLSCKSQHEKVLGYIEIGKAEGATLLTGGCTPAITPVGCYVAPTVFVDVKPSMRIWKEEIFGPVLSVITFSTEEEAIQLANDSEFGLGGAVISNDLDRANRVADALECGIVWINCAQPAFCQAPWGGIKNSGFGRELGEWGLENFLSVKQVTRYAAPGIWEWYPQSSKL